MRYLTVVVVVVLSLIFRHAFADCAPPNEVLKLSAAFQEEVGNDVTSDAYRETVEREVFRLADGKEVFSQPQYLVFVDRNPAVQVGSVVYLDLNAKRIAVVGTFPVSTGNPHRKGYFETPIGIFRNSPENMSYRALGTKNNKGWRGLGKKGSRVWDFGWQETKTSTGSPYKIRLLMHATDPDFGEPRLGKVDSEGCVRIPAKVNAFIDRYGILDASYENGPKWAKAVLLQTRSPLQFSGQYLLVGDSKNFSGA